MSQRRFRNQAERELIRDEVAAHIDRLGLPDHVPALRDLKAVVDQFVASANGRVFEGLLSIPELGDGRMIEYSLPGRRVQRQFVRLTFYRGGAAEPPLGAKA